MGRVIWSESALEHLQKIRDYIAQDSPRHSQRAAVQLVEATKQLESFPLSGRIVPELRTETIREMIEGAYRILYEVQPTHCEILGIYHSSRDLTKLSLPEE